MDGLLDFGQGLFSGAKTGHDVGGGNPWVTGASALTMGALSYFGGASQRNMERKANKLAIAGMEQDLELGEFNLSGVRRADRDARERKKRQETFGRLLGEYFAKKQGVK
jgi:hypothetical protein